MHTRIKSSFRFITIMAELICISFSAVACSPDSVKNGSDIIFYLPFESFTDNGVFYISDDIGHFIDKKTGYDVALCSKPNCPHKRGLSENGSSCDAYLGYDSSFLFNDDDYIYFMAAPDVEDAETILFDKILYRSEMDGRNKKIVSRLDGIQKIRCVAYKDGMAAVGYQKIMNKGKSDGEVFSDLEKCKTGVMLISLDSGEIKKTSEFEEYSACIYNVWFYDKKLYFLLFYTESDISKISMEEFKDTDDYYEYLFSNNRQKIISYDMGSGKEEIIWEGTTELINSENGDYLIIDMKDKTIFLKGDNIAATYDIGEMALHNPDFINKYVYDDMLYMADEKKVWSMDIKSGKLSQVAEGKLDGKGINRSIGIFEDVVYYMIIDDGKTVAYMIDKRSFFSGNLENARIIETQ